MITKICIGRLYNLGNFEHVRYELTAEVARGQDAANEFTKLDTIIARLNPVPPRSDYEVNHARKWLALSSKEQHDTVQMPFNSDGTEEEYAREIGERTRESQQVIDEQDLWRIRRIDAIKDLKHMGGSSTYRDAKDDLDHGDYNGRL